MECRYFGQCGACTLYADGYESQLQYKTQEIKKLFSSYYNGEIDVFPSKESHYRARAEFRIWHDGDNISYAMTSKEKEVVQISECPQVNETIFALMPKLLEQIVQKNIKEKLFGIDFLSATTGDVVVSLLYHKRLDSVWEEKANQIAAELGISIIGRSRKQKVVVGKDYVIEKLHIDNKEFSYKHIENSFTQPNPQVNEKMISWALQQAPSQGDLLELYCGAGNFTIPFATKFEKVLATEISKSSINAAKANMELNNIFNIEFVRMSVEEFVDALNGGRVYNRMKHIDIECYNFSTIFVDPPRSGMDEQSCALASEYETIIYISCNPKTLHRDLETLSKTHELKSMAVFDQFPYTYHLEMGVTLQRRK